MTLLCSHAMSAILYYPVNQDASDGWLSVKVKVTVVTHSSIGVSFHPIFMKLHIYLQNQYTRAYIAFHGSSLKVNVKDRTTYGRRYFILYMFRLNLNPCGCVCLDSLYPRVLTYACVCTLYVLTRVHVENTLRLASRMRHNGSAIKLFCHLLFKSVCLDAFPPRY